MRFRRKTDSFGSINTIGQESKNQLDSNGSSTPPECQEEYLRSISRNIHASMSSLRLSDGASPLRRNFLDLEDLNEKTIADLTESCETLVESARKCEGSAKILALKELGDSAVRYRSVRLILRKLSLGSALSNLALSSRDEEIRLLVSKAQLWSKENLVYDYCRDTALRYPSVPDIDNLMLSMQLKPFLQDETLGEVTLQLMEHLNLNKTNYVSFMNCVRAMMMPECVDFRPELRHAALCPRVCYLLIKYATTSESRDEQIKALGMMIEMSFRCRLARGTLTAMDAAKTSRDSFIDDGSYLSKRHRRLVEKLEFTLEHHEVFPFSADFRKELDSVLLQLVHEYLRSPLLFYLGSRLLAYTWLDFIFTDTKMFAELVSTIAEVSDHFHECRPVDVEILVVALFEKLNILTQRGVNIFKYALCADVVKLLRIFDRVESRRLYPGAYDAVMEFNNHCGSLEMSAIYAYHLIEPRKEET